MVGAAVSSVARWRFRNETRSEKPVSVTFLFREAAIYPVRPIEFFLPAADRPLPRDFPPMPKLAIDPGYPPTSIAEGTVVIEVDVDSAGVPRALREIGAPPNPLGQIALNAVRQWKFAPAIRNGRAVDGTAIVVITFPRPVV
jgi:protein TonB